MKKLNINKFNLLRAFNLNKLERPAIYIFTLIFFIIANLSLAAFSFRLDLSKGKAYTLSSSTKKIVRNLDDLVNIKFFVSSDLPTRLLPLKTEAIDLLNEFKKESRRINVAILDPKKDEKAANEARELGIPQLQFSQLEKDKYAVTSAYLGMGISFGGKIEIIPQVAEIENLEYNLTSSIYKLTRKEIVRVGIVGQPSLIQNDPLSLFRKIINQQFTTEEIIINENNPEINQDIKTLIVFDNNTTKYEENQLIAIKNYLDKGGKAIFFVDGVWVNENLAAVAAEHNLFNLLENYGIKINKDFVLSTSAELVNFGNETMQFLTPYPFWLKTNNFNQTVSYFSNINQLTLPWISSLTVEKKKNIETTFIIRSSNKSWNQKNSFNLDPQNIPNPNIADLKEFVLAAQSKIKNARIVVIPSSRFVLDRYLNRNSGNLEFVLNVLNDLASGGALAGIRSRAISFYPLPDLPETQKDIFKYANILLLPVIFGIYGTIRLIKRK